MWTLIDRHLADLRMLLATPCRNLYVAQAGNTFLARPPSGGTRSVPS